MKAADRASVMTDDEEESMAIEDRAVTPLSDASSSLESKLTLSDHGWKKHYHGDPNVLPTFEQQVDTDLRQDAEDRDDRRR